jgi:hypothetical protein
MTAQDKTAVVTGASTGLGAAYAQRLADRGYDLLLVARNKERLDALASDITARTGRKAEVLVADLTQDEQLATVEKRLRTDPAVGLLVNNAGGSLFTPLSAADTTSSDTLIKLNVGALTRLATAAVAGFTARGGHGAIVNISSALALNILPVSAVYSGTKSYVLTFTQALQQELAETGIRVQAVLPGAVRTEFWDGSGIELTAFPDQAIMTADDAVDAALAGFDAGEPVTIPSLPDIADWDALEQARQALIPNLSRATPAARYTK